MPVTPTFPGLYIEELPSSAHTITASPTSIAVFIGYTHPFMTTEFNKPVQLFGFSDYEAKFGSFFSNAAYDAEAARFSSVAHAVNQFFLNGGSVCYVVGLPAPPFPATAPATLAVPNDQTKPAIVFTALQPVDVDHVLTITIDNPDKDKEPTLVDITLTYGKTTGKNPDPDPSAIFEKYRSVSLNASADNFIEERLGRDKRGDKPAKYVSRLVKVSPSGAGYPPSFTTVPQQQFTANAPITGIITGATNAKPIVITTKDPHGFLTGQQVNISDVGGNTAANRKNWSVTRTGDKQFSLDDSKGNGAYTSGGIWNVAILKPSDYTIDTFKNDGLLDKLEVFNLLVLPGVTDSGILAAASAFAERKMALLIIDPAPDVAADDFTDANLPAAMEKNCALYFPYIKSSDPVTGKEIKLPPGGTVAGIFARTDLNRGVWKAPAGLETTVRNTKGVIDTGRMTNPRQGFLNGLGVNCLRDFPGIGTVVFGARTLVTKNPSLANQWRYVPVRRMALFLEQTLLANLGWVVFEPNDEPLWNAIRGSIEAFMLGLFRQGAFQGAKPSEAFLVKCDHQTTTQADIDNGIVNIVVAFAPLKPAEFVIIKIAQIAGQAQT